MAVVAVVLLLALLPVFRAGGRDAADGPRLTVATWNMCGVLDWGCAEFGDGAAKTSALVGLVHGRGARVVLLQEACAGDVEAARQALGATAWQLAFQPYEQVGADGRRSPVACGGGAERGDAGFGILANAELSGQVVVPAAQPTSGLQRGVLCATAGADLRVCAAHLSLPPSDRSRRDLEFRDDQLAALLTAAGDGPAVFGGDFNASPPKPGNKDAWIWPAAYFDRVQECDQQHPAQPGGRATHDNGLKLDYLFTALPRHGCRLADTGVSDHRALVLEVSAAL
ncbi:endonuclease/exonuclease/phosphatase family protein [Kitasatospora sp. NPDC049285]|uniref:endonuclease/exonuclease/phosphatase family protein n=1 Tax=Kitasatospora sp. NPDC049285 TaxID=3157096 RepID=UPI003426D0A2